MADDHFQIETHNLYDIHVTSICPYFTRRNMNESQQDAAHTDAVSIVCDAHQLWTIFAGARFIFSVSSNIEYLRNNNLLISLLMLSHVMLLFHLKFSSFSSPRRPHSDISLIQWQSPKKIRCSCNFMMRKGKIEARKNDYKTTRMIVLLQGSALGVIISSTACTHGICILWLVCAITYSKR